MPSHDIQTLITLFNQTFLDTENTELVCCEPDPIYRPADIHYPHHRIIFAHGFFASALHEIAHWCIAGKERRLLEDYGYWYQPDGRSAEQQTLFEKVEVKPQALEWLFSEACGFPFHFSADNLNGDAGPSAAFQQAVRQQAIDHLTQGLPRRAQHFFTVLSEHYQQNVSPADFQYTNKKGA